jgi:uncharacterized protein
MSTPLPQGASSPIDLVRNAQRARKLRPVWARLFARLRRSNPRNVDDTAQVLTQEAYEVIDCLQCANCCRTTSPRLQRPDIEKLARAQRMPLQAFEAKYVKTDAQGDQVFNAAPCPFLDQADNHCLVYSIRPVACQGYPHTDRKKFVQILELTATNAAMCPIALRVLEGMEAEFPAS